MAPSARRARRRERGRGEIPIGARLNFRAASNLTRLKTAERSAKVIRRRRQIWTFGQATSGIMKRRLLKQIEKLGILSRQIARAVNEAMKHVLRNWGLITESA